MAGGFIVNKDGFEKGFSPFGPNALDQQAEKMGSGDLIRDQYQVPFADSLLGKALDYVHDAVKQQVIEQAVEQVRNSAQPLSSAGQVFGDAPLGGNVPNLAQLPLSPSTSSPSTNTNSVFDNRTASFNDYGLSAAGLQTAGSTQSQLGDGTSPGTLSDISQQYLDTNTAFNSGTTAFNDYGLNATAGQFGNNQIGDGHGIGSLADAAAFGNFTNNTGALNAGFNAFGSVPNGGSVFSAGTTAYNDYALGNGASSNFGNDYNGNSYNGNDYASSFGGGYSGGGDSGGDFAPVVLDLTGHGINVTQLTSSNTYEDMTGDGYKNRTAWAGAGNGVLFVDTTGAGQLTQASQVIFTD